MRKTSSNPASEIRDFNFFMCALCSTEMTAMHLFVFTSCVLVYLKGVEQICANRNNLSPVSLTVHQD